MSSAHLSRRNCSRWLILVLATAVLAGCHAPLPPGTFTRRTGDEIVVAGQFVHTGTPVVLWIDPGGYDAYRVERRFSPYDESNWETSKFSVKSLATPNRYGLRRNTTTEPHLEKIRGGGWDLPLLQSVIDQFVVHFDVSGTSRQCFKTLHDARDLSVHFLLDLDGTIYQTLDLKERAWHATTSNTRSVGIEIANIGAYEPAQTAPFAEWYQRDAKGEVRITLPAALGDSGVRTPNFVGRPARAGLVTGEIQGRQLQQYDFTSEQYAALIKLTATLCRVFPRLKCDYPRDDRGRVVPDKLPDDVLENYRGILGHYHIQTNKVDPGPAFQWEHVISSARRRLATPAVSLGGSRTGKL